jgi:hypothetical protein
MGLFDFSGLMGGGDATAQQPSPADLQTIQSMAPGGAMPAAPAPGMFSGYSDSGQSAMKWAMAADIISNLRGGDGKALSMIGPLLEQNRQRQALKTQREAMSEYIGNLSPQMQKMAYAFPGEAAKAALGYQFNTTVQPETFTQMKGPDGRVMNVGSRGGWKMLNPSPNSVVNMGGNVGRDVAKGMLTKMDDTETALGDADTQLSRYKAWERAFNSLDPASFSDSTGLVPKMSMSVKNALSSLGVPIDKKALGTQEALVAMTNLLVAPLVKQLGANPSDRDLQLIVDSVMNIGGTYEGNRLILQYSIAVAERNRALVKARNDYFQDNMMMLETSPLQFRKGLSSAIKGVAGDAEQAYQKSIGAIFGKIGELKEKRKGKSEFVLNIPEETAPEETDDSSSTWNAF